MSITVSVIVVNYNTSAEVINCLHSVLCQQDIDFDVWVVDNASFDDSVARLQHTFGARIQLIASPDNLGFGRANNLASAKAAGEYLYLLNPDAQLTDPHDLKRLVEFLQARPRCGLAGTTVIQSDNQRLIATASQYPGQRHLKTTQGLQDLPGTIAWLQGSSMLLSRARFHQISGFDPDYFLYAEETDLCLRLRKAGHEIDVCTDVKVHHIGGASQRQAKIYDMRLRKQRGLYLFYTKHYSPDDARRLAKRARLHSLLNLLWLTPLSLCSPTKKIKRIRQRVTYQAAIEFLRNHE